MESSNFLTHVPVGLLLLGGGTLIMTALTPQRFWIRVNPEAIPEPLSRLWIIHLPFWMLNSWGKSAKLMFLCSGIGALATAIILLSLH